MEGVLTLSHTRRDTRALPGALAPSAEGAAVSVTNPAERFIAPDGSAVTVPASVAAQLERHLRLRRLRIAVRGQDPDLDGVLLALALAAAVHTTSATGSRTAAETQGATSSFMTASVIADELGISPRAVRAACAAGRLRAQLVGGSYLITKADFENFRLQRRVA